jgi:hypothetical protein
MAELTNGVSWIGVIVGAVAAFIAGWIWYSPKVLGKKWAEGNGIEMGTASEMPVGAMVSQALGLFLMSWFVGVTAASNALATVILATLAFTVLAYSGALFLKRNSFSRNVDAGYWILALVVMIIAQGIF